MEHSDDILEYQSLIESNEINYDDAFTYACKNGHIDVAKWLLSIKSDIDISANDDKAFTDACLNDHINIAKWFIELNPQKYVIEIINSKIVSFQIRKTLKLLPDVISFNEIKQCIICCIEQSNIITRCNHQFCNQCLNSWYTINKTCPCCRELLINCNKILLQ